MANMAKFYKLKVAEVTRETADCVSIAFDIPEEGKKDYAYIQGQYLTLKLKINGEDIRRSYSICSSPIGDEKLRVAIKKVKDGKGSIYLNEKVKAGDELEVMTPMGNFHTELNPSHKKTYVLFAGGSGITPMLSIIKTVLNVEKESKIILFYGNQDEASIIFKNQLDLLQQNHADKLKVYHILNESSDSNPIFKGIMNTEKNKTLVESFVNRNEDNEFFICGPTGMMNGVVQALTDLKIDNKRVHIEYFAPPVEDKVINELNTAEKPGYVKSEVTIICDGDERTVNMEPGQNVLEVALAANVDAPYACRGGSCCTCRALLVEGKVEMAINFALLDSEVEEGYILTCQSHALTPKLVVDYDRGR